MAKALGIHAGCIHVMLNMQLSSGQSQLTVHSQQAASTQQYLLARRAMQEPVMQELTIGHVHCRLLCTDYIELCNTLILVR